MNITGYTWFITWAGVMFLVAGAFLLGIDANSYAVKRLVREARSATLLGWVNVCLGIASFVGNWIYSKWFW